MKENKGIPFEKLVEIIFNKLKDNPQFEEVQQGVSLPGPDKVRKVDVVLNTTTPEGVKLRTIIECKDYKKKKVGIGLVGEFASLLNDLSASKGIMVASGQFTSGARTKAKRLNISLCSVESTLHPDWNVNLEIPILFDKIAIEGLSFDFGEKGINLPRSFSIRDGNRKEILDTILEQWVLGQLPLREIEEWQEIEWTDPTQYYLSSFESNFGPEPVTIHRINIKLKIQYFLSTLNRLQDVNIIKDVNERETTIFIGGLDGLKLLERCTEINRDEIPTFNKFYFHFEMLMGFGDRKINVPQEKYIYVTRKKSQPK